MRFVIMALLLTGCASREVVFDQPGSTDFVDWVAQEMPIRTAELGLPPIRVEIVSDIAPPEHGQLSGWFSYSTFQRPMITLWLYSNLDGIVRENSEPFMRELFYHEMVHYWVWWKGETPPSGSHWLEYHNLLQFMNWIE